MTIYYIGWFVVALVLLIVEINAMSFYLVALALGAIAGGISAYMEQTFTQQAVVAGIVTMIAAILSFYLRKKLKSPKDKSNNVLDIGQRVTVQPDNINADGSAKVLYRGTEWQAFASEGSLSSGIFLIESVNGTQLILGTKVSEYPEKKNSDNASDNASSQQNEPKP